MFYCISFTFYPVELQIPHTSLLTSFISIYFILLGLFLLSMLKRKEKELIEIVPSYVIEKYINSTVLKC